MSIHTRAVAFANLWLISLAANAEQPVVQTAPHTAANVAQQVGDVVPFSQVTTEMGERVNQRVGIELNVHTVIKQAEQIAHEGDSALRRRQERSIEVLEAVDGRCARRR